MRVIGKYRLETRLGEGGYGEVWGGVLEGDLGFRRKVAVKLIREPTGEHATRFVNEARIGARLHHPNIVDVYEFDRIDGQYLLAMELVEGETLERLLDRSPDGLPPERALSIVRQIAAALRHAHELADDDGRPLSVVHRDLKPANIMLDASGAVKVLDFGLAVYRTSNRTTAPGVAKGTLSYMAPEMLEGDEPSSAVDVWALGAIAYEAVTGKAVAPLGDLLQAVLAIQRADGASLAAEVAPRSATLAAVVAHTLVMPPERRWSAAQVLAAVAEAPSGSRTPSVAPKPPVKPWKRWPLLLAGLAVAALGIGAVALRDTGGPARGGELRMVWPRVRGALDPFERTTTIATRMLPAAIEPLVGLDADGQVVPGPVESWEEAGDTLVLTLRDDLRFHPHPCLAAQGRPAGAEDLRASLDWGREMGRFHAEITSIEEVDDRSVRVRLAHRSPFALRDLADIPLLPVDLERCEQLHDMRQPMGTGPFRFAAPADGEVLELVANEHYWRKDEEGRQLPYLDGIVARSANASADEVRSAGDALRELAAGEIDVFDASNATLLAEHEIPEGVVVLPETQRGTVGVKAILAFRDRPRPLGLDLRRAIAMAIDRGALAEGPDAEEFVPGARLLPPEVMGFDAGEMAFGLDRNRAERLVEAAGGWTGDPLVLGAFEADLGLAEGIAQSLGEIGLPTRVVRFTLESFAAAMRAPTADLLVLESYGPLWGTDPYPALAELVADVGAVADVSPGVRALVTTAAQEPDRDARELLYAAIERGILEDASFIPLGTIRPKPTAGLVVREGVHGFEAQSLRAATRRDLAVVWIEP